MREMSSFVADVWGSSPLYRVSPERKVWENRQGSPYNKQDKRRGNIFVKMGDTGGII